MYSSTARDLSSALTSVVAPSHCQATLAHTPIPLSASISGCLSSESLMAVSWVAMHGAFWITPAAVRQLRKLVPSTHGGVTAARSWNEVTPFGIVRFTRREIDPGGILGITSTR